MALRTISLCSGIGGLDLGARMAVGARTVCYVERDAYAASVLVARMADEKLDQALIWDDLRSFDCGPWRGRVDLVTGGYPCQPFSTAGRRRGADDERHLWPEVLRIYRDTGARWLFCENVRGHLSLGFADVLADLASLGCDAEWVVLRASDVGAPHRRERLFFLADAKGGDGSVQLLGRGPRQASPEPGGRGEALADARRRASGALQSLRQQERCLQTMPCSEGETVADAHQSGLEGRGGPVSGSGDERSAWPPRPEDEAGWREYITGGGPEPAVRGGPDGPAYRVDRLRCLGNAVVPQQAALALRILGVRLGLLVK